MEGINHGLAVLGWFENYQQDEIPPENIWDDSTGIDEWFKRVRQKQKDRFENPSAAQDDDNDEGTDNSMMGNDLADFFKE